MVRSLSRSKSPRGTLQASLVLILASLPFVLRIAVIFSGITGYVFQSAYKILQLLVPVFWRYRTNNVRGWKLLWPVEEPLPPVKTWFIATVMAAVMGVLGIIATTLITHLLNLDKLAIQTQLNVRFSISATGAIIIVILLATLNAGLEELHFRYWLDREISKVWGSVAGISISAAAFGLMHFLILAGTGVLSPLAQLCIFIALCIAGTSWSLLARQPGGIHAAWLSHGLTNVILMSWGLRWLGYI